MKKTTCDSCGLPCVAPATYTVYPDKVSMQANRNSKKFIVCKECSKNEKALSKMVAMSK